MPSSNTAPIALVIEDDVATQHMLLRVLRSAGLAPIGFGSAEAGIAWIEMNGAPAFVSTDVCLPRMSGFELCAWLHEHAPGVAVAIVTARCSLEDEIRAVELDAVYVEKPVHIREYLDVVASLLEDRQQPLPVTPTQAPQSVHFWSKAKRSVKDAAEPDEAPHVRGAG